MTFFEVIVHNDLTHAATKVVIHPNRTKKSIQQELKPYSTVQHHKYISILSYRYSSKSLSRIVQYREVPYSITNTLACKLTGMRPNLCAKSYSTVQHHKYITVQYYRIGNHPNLCAIATRSIPCTGTVLGG